MHEVDGWKGERSSGRADCGIRGDARASSPSSATTNTLRLTAQGAISCIKGAAFCLFIFTLFYFQFLS